MPPPPFPSAPPPFLTPTPPPAPPTELADPGGSPADRFGYHLLRAGEARPVRADRLVASEDGTCAMKGYEIDTGSAYRWREVRDPKGEYPAFYRVYLPGAVASLSAARFGDLFPGATA